MTRGRGERGAVTAELAMGLPLLVALTLCLVWLLSLAAGQVRVVDAAREAARLVARGDDPEQARGLAERIAPDGVAVEISRDGDWVVVRASVRVEPFDSALGRLGAVTLSAESTAAAESPR